MIIISLISVLVVQLVIPGSAGAQILQEEVEILRFRCGSPSKMVSTQYPQACFDLAKRYHHGDDVDVDLSLALKLYDKACDYGISEGCLITGTLLASGEAGVTDKKRAYALLADTCTKETPEACYKLAAIGSDISKTWSHQKGIVGLQRQACEAGYQKSCHEYGVHLLNGRGVKTNRSMAVPLFDKACAAKVGAACIELGLLSLKRRGVSNDRLNELNVKQIACSQKSEPLCGALTERYNKRLAEQKTAALKARAQQVEAEKLIQAEDARAAEEAKAAQAQALADTRAGKAAEAAEAAEAAKAQALADAQATEAADAAKAQALADAQATEAADAVKAQALADAQAAEAAEAAEIAEAQALADAQAAEAAEAAEIAEATKAAEVAKAQAVADAKAAEAAEAAKAQAQKEEDNTIVDSPVPEVDAQTAEMDGCEVDAVTDVDACLTIGLQYQNGIEQKKSHKIAAGYFTRGCESGSQASCVELARYYRLGRGVQLYPQKAFNLFLSTCEQGLGCVDLGRMYEQGEGTVIDDAAAERAFIKGCDMGDNDSCEAVKTRL
jgi:TPR repeat protein